MSKQLTFDEITEFMATGKGTRPNPPKRPEVLTPDSPRWGEFVRRLCSAMDSRGGCAGGTNKENAIAAMREMSGIDIEASLEYFEDHGGYCDCEILLNVDRDWSWMERSN